MGPALIDGGGNSPDIMVTPPDLFHASQKFATGQNTMTSITDTLYGALIKAAGMAGNDSGGHKFAGKYDPAAKALINDLCAAVRTLGGMSTGLVTNANNYIKAEHHNTIGAKGSVPTFMAWWDSDTGTMVIWEGDNGTFMQPGGGYDYFLSQVKE